MKWAWRTQFLSHTLQILEINQFFEAVKMVLPYLVKISFSFWYKKMATSSPSIYRDLHALECIVQVCTTRELWPPSILQLSSFTHTPFHIKRCSLCRFSFNYWLFWQFDNFGPLEMINSNEFTFISTFSLDFLTLKCMGKIILLNAKFIKSWTLIVLNDLLAYRQFFQQSN